MPPENVTSIPVIKSDPHVLTVRIEVVDGVKDGFRFWSGQKASSGKSGALSRGVGKAEWCLHHLEAELLGQGPAVLADKSS